MTWNPADNVPQGSDYYVRAEGAEVLIMRESLRRDSLFAVEINGLHPFPVEISGLDPFPEESVDDVSKNFLWLFLLMLRADRGHVWHFYDYLWDEGYSYLDTIRQDGTIEPLPRLGRLYPSLSSSEESEGRAIWFQIAVAKSQFYGHVTGYRRAVGEGEPHLYAEKIGQTCLHDGIALYSHPRGEFWTAFESLADAGNACALRQGVGDPSETTWALPEGAWEATVMESFEMLAMADDDGNAAMIVCEAKLLPLVRSCAERMAQDIVDALPGGTQAWTWSEFEAKLVPRQGQTG